MKDPYKIFFPLGIFSAFIGVLSWLPFAMGYSNYYPGTEHPHLLIGGFLYSFAIGFLMTAIPRFTETTPAKLWEVGCQGVVILVMILTGAMSLISPDWRSLSLLLQSISLFFLIGFLISRFLRRKRTLPSSFLFVGIGILCGMVGSVLLYLDERGAVSTELSFFGRSLFYHGMMLSLVIGVGSRIVPVLLGRESSPMNPISPTQNRSFLGGQLGLALAYFLSFPVEFLFFSPAGRGVRALVLSFVAVRFWKIFHSPNRKGALPFLIQLAGLLILVGQWTYAIFPGYAVHGVHLTFAGGYSLLTLLIATRVILSHGGYDLTFELRSRRLYVMGGLVAASALTRFLAPLAPKSYVHHLGYAALGWCIGVAIWGFDILPKAYKKGPLSDPNG